VIELRPTDVANGGEAVARVDGKAHFVDGAMPGERVRGEVVRSKGSWARVELREVIEGSKASGGMFPTTTLITKKRIFVPVPDALVEVFRVSTGPKEFFVRFDVLSSDAG